ncbi:MAG TPA: GNAT family N-acetyltransferase [Hyphomicrobiaceae bacterium]|nr:GNAT family N-acetyltransferase [Hyphomicrobiaceae bacterium]
MIAQLGHTDLSLLQASQGHAREFAELHALLFSQSWDEASFRQLLGHPGSAAFLARVPTPPQTIGLILGRLAADEAELLTLGVHEGHRRHGIARRLVAALMQAAKGGGARRLFLEVGRNNAAAVALYRGLGFCQVGIRHGYYEHGQRRDDALVLALGL